MNSKTIQAYKCSKCVKAYLYESAAEKCCTAEETPQKKCEDCGAVLPKNSYFLACGNCREKRRYNRCTKMTITEYEENYPAHMVVDRYDNYYPSTEDALENWSENREEVPEYVYGTKKIYAEVDIESAVERALEDAYEDAEFSNIEELYSFVDEWNKKNRLTMFEETKIVIDIPEELRKEYS